MQYYCYWAASPSWLKLLFGSLEYHRRNGQRRGRYYELFRARYKFPELFSTKLWDVTGYRSCSDWSVNLRAHRIVPLDAPIFEAIEDGDTALVQSLLATKEAFITDTDKWGDTLLHVSLPSAILICKLNEL